MAKVIKFRLTKKAVYRAAVREMEKMYRLSHGGSDPIVDEYSREMFEDGQIDEVKWVTWHKYCQNMLADLTDDAEKD